MTADECRRAGAADAADDPEPSPDLAARLAGILAPYVAAAQRDREPALTG